MAAARTAFPAARPRYRAAPIPAARQCPSPQRPRPRSGVCATGDAHHPMPSPGELGGGLPGAAGGLAGLGSQLADAIGGLVNRPDDALPDPPELKDEPIDDGAAGRRRRSRSSTTKRIPKTRRTKPPTTTRPTMKRPTGQTNSPVLTRPPVESADTCTEESVADAHRSRTGRERRLRSRRRRLRLWNRRPVPRRWSRDAMRDRRRRAAPGRAVTASATPVVPYACPAPVSVPTLHSDANPRCRCEALEDTCHR